MLINFELRWVQQAQTVGNRRPYAVPLHQLPGITSRLSPIAIFYTNFKKCFSCPYFRLPSIDELHYVVVTSLCMYTRAHLYIQYSLLLQQNVVLSDLFITLCSVCVGNCCCWGNLLDVGIVCGIRNERYTLASVNGQLQIVPLTLNLLCNYYGFIATVRFTLAYVSRECE